MSCWAVIVAAGRGERSGLARNKVFYLINGVSVLGRCVEAFQRSGLFDGIAVVISHEDEALFQALREREPALCAINRIAYGAETRRKSVYNGLLCLPKDCEIVAIHDAARPFVTQEVIAATVESALKWGSGVISTPVVDTVKQLMSDGSVISLDRSTLRAVQTPQTFRCERILEAHRMADREELPVTDDAMLFEHYYGQVRLVTAPGAEENIKLTTRHDFESLKPRPVTRIGHGYDAHRLAEGRRLILCGVEVPHDRGLDGHSDADVAVHALMDALLGALGEGDIGRHFPDSDPQYKGISSMRLLERVMHIVREKGFGVANADITIVAQKPRLLSYMPAMRESIASGLGVVLDQVNVKATTTEHMGFEGEEKGISAQAVALLISEA